MKPVAPSENTNPHQSVAQIPARRAFASRRHWFCVAYAFPPINRSGTHRTLGFVSHLDRLGWDATVLTVDPTGEESDHSLFDQLPRSTTILRAPWTNIAMTLKTWLGLSNPEPQAFVRAKSSSPINAKTWKKFRSICTLAIQRIGQRLSRWPTTPDSRIGWIIPAVHQGLDSIRHRRPEILYSTSPYMSAHLIALVLHLWTRIPWVADFRDPWRGNPFREIPGKLLNLWDAVLERMVVSSASCIVCNTPAATEQMKLRFPAIAHKCRTILNGFDAADFEGLMPIRTEPQNAFVMTHSGQFYGKRSPQVWFAALARAVRISLNRARPIVLQLIGPETFDGRPLIDLAHAAGVAEHVRILGRMDHHETLGHLAGSDALILAGTEGVGSELQIPGKLFEYLAIRKPILATASFANHTEIILKQSRADAIVCQPNDEKALSSAMLEFISRVRRTNRDTWQGVKQFDRAHRARQLVEVFTRLIGHRPRRQTAPPFHHSTFDFRHSTFPLHPVQDKRIALFFPADGGFRPVTGKNPGGVRKGHEILTDVLD